MTNNDKAINANAEAAARYAAETNALHFVPANAPRRTGKVRTARRSTARRIIR